MSRQLKKTKLFGGIIRFIKVYPISLLFICSITTNAQILHTTNCSTNASSFIWSTTPSGNNNFDWTDGDLTKVLNNVGGSNVNITYTFSGETNTLIKWGNSSTTDSPAVGTDTFTGEKLQFFTSGFVSGNGIIITINFSTPVQEASFDLIHVNGNGTNGDKYTITATNTLNNTIFPTFTSAATPSYTANSATGIINSTSSSTTGNNASVGVNFTDTNKLTSITILWQDCDTCSLGAIHGSGITGLTFCENLPDNDNDTVPDFADLDDDNDGILDTTEQNGNPTRDTDGDGIPNHLDLDSDNDGITDVIEAGGTDANKDGKADDDDNNVNNNVSNGIPTSAGTGITPINSDSDALPNHLDIDSDNDGIPDNIEAQNSFYYTPPSGLATTITDINNNGLDDVYENGSLFGINPQNTDLVDNPDYLDEDSDNDGIPDIQENGDTDNVTAGTDVDSDGLDDNFDDNNDTGITGFTVNDGLGVGNTVTNISTLETAYNDADNDFNPGAGNLDFRDSNDTDGDGVLDIDDVDDDNDGILDANEGTGDLDGDGIPNHLDLDSDGDGCPDALEGDANINSSVLMQSVLNGGNSGTGYTGSSSSPVVSNFGYVGTNGLTMLIPGGLGQSVGTSQDGTKNRCIDTDNDGIADIDDLDDDNDGIMDTQELCASEPILVQPVASIEIEIDMDANPEEIGFSVSYGGTNIISFPTGSFGVSFANSTVMHNQSVSQNGTYTFTINDTAGNGLQGNSYRVYVNSMLVANGTFNSATTSSNFMVSSIILDSFSCFNADPSADSDQDGLLNYQDADFCTLNTSGACSNMDFDNDGIPNHLDLDSDGDGCPDAIEAAVPALLTSGNVVNNFPNTTTNTANAIVNITSDIVGTNGFASSLETTDNLAPNTAHAITTTNYPTYALNATINGCGTPMITQVYWKGTDFLVEVTNSDDTKVVVPKGATLTFFNNGITTSSLGGLGNSLAIMPGESMLFNTSSFTAQIKSGVTSVSFGATPPFLDNVNDILTISRSTLSSSSLPWESRIDVITNLTDNTSFVRIDETLVPNTTYTASEWVAFIDDRPIASGGLNPYTNPPQRHPHDPLLSEITSGVDLEANALLGLHRFAPTIRAGSAWSNGFPDRSRHVIINENYNHNSSRLSARKISVNNNSKLAITNNLLVVTDDVTVTNSNDEIRLVGDSQLIQTHTGTSQVFGNGKLLVDQNSTVASKYRYNYMSSPVNTIGATTYSIETVLKDGTAPLDAFTNIGTIAKDITFVSSYDGNTTNPISLADYWFYTYAPSSDGRSNWLHKYKDGIIKQTDGFIMKGPGVAQNYTFIGTPKDGNLTANPAIGANESYLIGNPFSSAISVKKFIEDNINSTTATLYFWQHVGEENSTGATSGHNYAGYVGGYATRNIAMGLSANNPTNVSGFNFPIQAESSLITNGSIVPNIPAVGQSVVLINSIGSSIEFSNIIKGVDVLKINYQSLIDKSITIKVDGVDKGQFNLVSTGSNYDVANITLCVEAGSDVTIVSNDTIDTYIDFLQLQDADGNISCTPSAGGTNASLVPEAYIPIGQGFFIQGDSNGGPIVFNNSQREFIKEGINSVFFKEKNSSAKTKKSEYVLPIIKLGMDFLNKEKISIHRQIGISFDPNNSFDFDKGYDSEIYDLGDTDVYWKLPNDDLKYIILGVEPISDESEIPFDIIMDYNGSITIKIDEIKAINKEVFIKDSFTNKTYLLSDRNTVAFQLNKGIYTERFSLVFNGNVLSVDDNVNETLNKELSVFMDAKVKELVIHNLGNSKINKVELFNILGQKIRQWNTIENVLENRLKMKGLSNQIYVVNIHTNKGKIFKKIVKK